MMKIDDISHSRPSQDEQVRTQQAQRREPAGPAGPDKTRPGGDTPPVRDEVELSPEARAVQAVKKAAKEVPDVRQDRVQELQQQLDAGTYEVDTDQLARKMLEHLDG